MRRSMKLFAVCVLAAGMVTVFATQAPPSRHETLGELTVPVQHQAVAPDGHHGIAAHGQGAA